MNIDRIELAHVRIPLLEPFRISSGAVTEKDTIVCAVSAGGLTGLGEASPMAGSFYSDDSPDSVWTELEERLIPALKRAGDVDAARAAEILDAASGSGFARAGLETACRDLEARAQGIPLWRLLGGSGRPVPSGLAVGIYPTADELVAACERHLAAGGYRRIKVKIRPGWDVVPLEAVRRRFPGVPLTADANAAYDRTRHRDALRALDAFGLEMLEQPLARGALEDSARLQGEMRTPICLDESAEDPAAVDRAIRLGACRIVNIKLQRVGGFAAGKAMHDLCAAKGIPTWVGTMPELGIASWQAVHFATLPHHRFPTDVESSARWFTDEIVDPSVVVRDGFLHLPDGPGTGVVLRGEVMRKHRVRSAVF